jgi:mono/diheme cytochrome c family protein
MTKTIRSLAVLAVAVCLTGAMCLAESSGQATYKTKCAMCHGATGTPSAAMTKAMGIKSASDPAITKLTSAEMSSAVKNGKGKMKPIAGLTNQQITDVVAFYRSLK